MSTNAGSGATRAARAKKSTSKFPDHLAISRSREHMPREESASLKEAGKALVNPDAQCAEAYRAPDGEPQRKRYKGAVLLQYKDAEPVQVDLHIHSVVDRRKVGTGSELDMRFYVHQNDLPAGVHWQGNYKFRVRRQDNEPRLLVVIEDADLAAAKTPAHGAANVRTGGAFN